MGTGGYGGYLEKGFIKQAAPDSSSVGTFSTKPYNSASFSVNFRKSWPCSDSCAAAALLAAQSIFTILFLVLLSNSLKLYFFEIIFNYKIFKKGSKKPLGLSSVTLKLKKIETFNN